MEKELEKCITDFIVSRCASAFQESEEFKNLQSNECSPEELLDSALMIGYKKGASDAINLLKYLQPQNTATQL